MKLIAILHGARRIIWRVWRPHTRGAQVMLMRGTGEVLLVRHHYGSGLWMFPGGGIGRKETPEFAAAREVREELGCQVESLTPFGVYAAQQEYKRDTVHLFTGTTRDTPRAASWEIAQVCWFPLDAPPPDAAPSTLRRLAEYRGSMPPTADW